MDNIDTYAQAYAKASERIRQAIVGRYIDLYKKGMRNPEAFRSYILSKNVANEIVDTLGLGDIHDAMIQKYYTIAATAARIEIPEIFVDSLIKLDSMEFYNHVRDVGTELQKQLFNFSLGGKTEKDIAEALMKATKELSEAQVNALTNTSMRTVSRSAFAESIKDMPEDTLYTYFGPDDSLMRPDCEAVMHNPQNEEGFTLAKIADLPVDLVFGGGFGCRHSWELAKGQE